MAETKFPKRRAFAMQKPRKTERTESPRRTERQRAADKRRREEARAMGGYAKGPQTPETRMTALQPGQVRITGLIVDELTRALGVILKLDGPADVLMKLFFRSNPRLGMRDRGIIAEGIYYALRHLGTLSWAMHPVPPARAPRLVALATLARQHGIESLPPASIGREEGPLKNVLAADFSKAPPHIQAELPEWIYSLLEAQYDDTKELYASMLDGAPLDLRVNLLKASREEVLQELAANGVEAYPTPFSPDGVRLPTKPGLTQWPIYKEGKVDVQDEGSQLIARLLTPRRREMICDFCAGAGGKTLAIGALSHQLVPARLGIAHERVGARLRVRDDARRFFLGRLHDRPIDRAAHLVDIGGLIGVDPQRTGLVPQLNLGSVPHLLLQIVPKFLVQGLIERPRAHLLVVEPTVHDWRERHVHMIANGQAVLAHLVPVDEPAHHVLLAELL